MMKMLRLLSLLSALFWVAVLQAQSIVDYGIITDQPQGELHVYKRSGKVRYFDESSNKLASQSQLGIFSVVFAGFGTVYLQNPVSEITGYLYRGCWVKGSVDDAGTTITVPLGQYVDYIQSFDVVSELKLFRYDSQQNTFVIDEDATEVTYTIGDDGTIRLNGTSANYILSAVYRSPNGHEVGSLVDGLWAEVGDYESVYTPLDDQPITPPKDIQAEEFNFMATANDGLDWLDYNSAVLLAFDGDDVYLQGFSRFLPNAWIKGRREGDRLIFASGQFLGSYSNEPLYLMGGRDTSSGGVSITDVVFTFDGNDTYTTTDYVIINGKKDELYIYLYYYGAVITKQANELVEAPEDMKVETYTLAYQTYNASNRLVSADGFVNIGMKDGEVYMQRICEFLPDAWVKGRLENGRIVFEGQQFLGFYEEDNEQMPAYFIPFDMLTGDLLPTISFDYDKEAGTLDAKGQAVGICLNRARLLTYMEIRNPRMTIIPDVAIVPANPSVKDFIGAGNDMPYIAVQVPGKGANGETLNLNKLSYQLLADVEKDIQPIVLTTEFYERLPYTMEAIPWLYADNYDVSILNNDVRMVYLNTPVDSYNRIGVQSIYTAGGETSRSAIDWWGIKGYTTGIEESAVQPTDHVIYDLQGRRIQKQPRRGLYISGGRKYISF